MRRCSLPVLGSGGLSGGCMKRYLLLGSWGFSRGFMKRYLLLLPVLGIGSRVVCQSSYQPVDKVSMVQFNIKSLGFTVTGSFGGLSGKIVFDPAEPRDAVFDVTIDAGSVNTDNGMRDDHLRKGSFFDTEHYPKIRLVSGDITFYRNGTYLFNGNLTIKGHTKGVSFPFSAAQVDGGYRFKGSFAINRSDFGVGGSGTISDRAEINLDITVK